MNRVDISNAILRTGSKPDETCWETLAVSVVVQQSTSDIERRDAVSVVDSSLKQW